MSKYLPSEKEFEEIFTLVNKKMDEKDLSWLKFDSLFPEAGKQGIVGIAKVDNKKCVFKSSRYINHLVKHEEIIMKSLNDLRKFCPHFCKYYVVVKHSVDGNYREVDNPFEIKSKYPILIDTLLMEYIEGKKLYDLIKDNNIREEVLFSTIKQLLLATCVSQQYKKFTHYDLHSCNVMMKKCEKNSAFLYVLDEGNQFCVPTHGYYPCIIDYGFSYIGDMENKPIYSSLAHTDVGFMTDGFDNVSDSKLLLVTVSEELKKYRGSRKSKSFSNIVENIFEPLSIDWESGWDDIDDVSAANYVLEKIENVNHNSKFFTDYDHFCIDVIQSLITLPLKPRSSSQIKDSYKIFVEEFGKIEREIVSPIFNLYILKNIIDSARYVKNDYSKSKKRAKAVKTFRGRIYDCVTSISKYCYPTSVSYEKMLCSLLLFSQGVEGILYQKITKLRTKKESEYSQLRIRTPESIYGAIEVNIEDDFTYDSQTKIYIWDSFEQKRSVMRIPPNMVNKVNRLPQIIRGSLIYDIFKGKEIYNSDVERSERSEEESERSEEERSEEERSERSGNSGSRYYSSEDERSEDESEDESEEDN